MGQKGKEIVGEKVDEIIARLNKAMAAEALDAYRYLYLSKWAAGVHAPEAAELFALISQDEWMHLGVWMERIVELGGRPLVSTKEFEKAAYTQYQEPPKSRKELEKMVQDSLVGERAAIQFYKDLADFCRVADPVTYRLALDALADEIDDEEKLENLLD